MTYRYMQQQTHQFPVRKMARLFEVSVSGFYAWLKRTPSQRQVADKALVEQIKRIHKQHKRRYGSPRITEELQAEQVKVSHNRVARLMRVHGIVARRKRRYVHTTDSTHRLPVADNLLARQFQAQIPGTKWVSDITYLPTTSGWLYLTVIIDLWDRKVIGWSLANDLSASHVVRALTSACQNRRPQPDLLFHSDRGSQYCSQEFRQALLQVCPTVRQSMSRKGNCWDNACAESFFKTLKHEMDGLKGRSTKDQVRLAVFEYIEAYYNRIRRHSALGYHTPVSFKLVA